MIVLRTALPPIRSWIREIAPFNNGFKMTSSMNLDKKVEDFVPEIVAIHRIFARSVCSFPQIPCLGTHRSPASHTIPVIFDNQTRRI
jgi:hypothetical protein